MHLFFVDESGTAPPPDKTNTKYFVVGGVIISEDQWHHVAQDLHHIKNSFSISGEVKWRFFGQKIGQEQKENNLRHLSFEQRDSLRTAVFSIINKYQSMRLICTVANVIEAYQKRYVKSSEDLYWHTYKPLTRKKRGIRFSNVSEDRIKKLTLSRGCPRSCNMTQSQRVLIITY